MGWSSQDDLLNQITTNGKYGNVFYNKTLASAGTADTGRCWLAMRARLRLRRLLALI
jgi:hypothetical protein